MKKFLIVASILFTSSNIWGQNFLPSNPLEIPIVLSGTFAELRGNHFHGGIDIKTQGRSGLKVRAVADGYISRIAVSPYGYGNALYVRHPEGYTTVYGTLMPLHPRLRRMWNPSSATAVKTTGISTLAPTFFLFHEKQ
jgi:hypothetical protein